MSRARSTAAALLAGQADRWPLLLRHPFVTATADGSLPASTFDRWIVADHYFVVGFRRFLAGLLALAPDEPAREVLTGGLEALIPELALFRREAAARDLDLHVEPGPVTLGYTGWLQASLLDGWPTALAALFGAEQAYLDAWTAVRAGSAPAYRSWVENWSSPAFVSYVDDLAGLLGDAPPTAAQERVFDRVVRFELHFWDGVYAGESWA